MGNGQETVTLLPRVQVTLLKHKQHSNGSDVWSGFDSTNRFSGIKDKYMAFVTKSIATIHQNTKESEIEGERSRENEIKKGKKSITRKLRTNTPFGY